MPKNHVSVPDAFLSGTLKFIEGASFTVKRAMDEVATHRQQQKRAAAAAAPLLERMVATGLVAGNQKEAAAAMLGAHAETLGLLKAAVDKIVKLQGDLANTGRAAKQAGDLGSSYGDPSPGAGGSSYNSLTSPFVGERTSELKESDRALLAVLD